MPTQIQYNVFVHEHNIELLVFQILANWVNAEECYRWLSKGEASKYWTIPHAQHQWWLSWIFETRSSILPTWWDLDAEVADASSVYIGWRSQQSLQIDCWVRPRTYCYQRRSANLYPYSLSGCTDGQRITGKNWSHLCTKLIFAIQHWLTAQVLPVREDSSAENLTQDPERWASILWDTHKLSTQSIRHTKLP